MHDEIVAARLGKKGVSWNQEPRLLGCRHLGGRRGNPTSGASRQRAAAWKHQSGSGSAEIGWLNNGEHHGSVTFNRLKVLTSLNQNGERVGSPGEFDGDGSSNSRRTMKMQPRRSQLLAKQQGKPYPPRCKAVSGPQGMGMAERVEDRGGSEGRPVIGRIGPPWWGYPARKGADFRMWSQRQRSLGTVQVVGDVGR